MKILLIDNYDSFTFNLYHYLSSLKTKVDVIRNDKITSKEILKNKYDKIVISPGPGNPNQSGNCLDILNTLYKEIPFLGVCLGHQTIGQAFGGKIIHAKTIMHGKTSLIHHTNEGVFKGISNPFTATRYHSLVIEKESIPDCFDITAWTEDQEIMGIQHKSLPIEGVQFHPESILTEYGHDLLSNFVKKYE